jgi:hypothetical protein
MNLEENYRQEIVDEMSLARLALSVGRWFETQQRKFSIVRPSKKFNRLARLDSVFPGVVTVAHPKRERWAWRKHNRAGRFLAPPPRSSKTQGVPLDCPLLGIQKGSIFEELLYRKNLQSRSLCIFEQTVASSAIR